MWGISEIVARKTMIDSEREIRRMNDIIEHRGPDGEGIYCYRKVIQERKGKIIQRIKRFAKNRMPIAIAPILVVYLIPAFLVAQLLGEKWLYQTNKNCKLCIF